MAETLERNLFLFGKIEEENAEKIIESVIKINKEDTEKEKSVVDYNRKDNPIKFYICTPGGDLYSGLAIYDQVKCSKTPIWIYVSGTCCSAGFLILCAGDKRIGYPNAEIMYHQLSSRVNGSMNDISESVEQLKRIQNRIEQCVLIDTKITKAQLKEVREKRQDWYLTPEEALKYGVIDEIISYENK